MGLAGLLEELERDIKETTFKYCRYDHTGRIVVDFEGLKDLIKDQQDQDRWDY